MTTCTQQTFEAQIKRLQREVEGLTKTRELQETRIQELEAIKGCGDCPTTYRWAQADELIRATLRYVENLELWTTDYQGNKSSCIACGRRYGEVHRFGCVAERLQSAIDAFTKGGSIEFWLK